MTSKFEDCVKRWNDLLIENKGQWAKEFYSLIKDGEFWDMTFMQYWKFALFKKEFKDEIRESIDEYKRETGEFDVNYDAFAFSMLESSISEMRENYKGQGGIS